MSPAELLSRCRVLGIEVMAEADGALALVTGDDIPDDILEGLRANKTAVHCLLTHRGWTAWDAAAAELAVRELHAEVSQIRASFGGTVPATLAALLTDALTIGERYIRDHEVEAARGWDALELLRDLVPHVRDLATRWTRTHARTAVIGRRTDGPARGH